MATTRHTLLFSLPTSRPLHPLPSNITRTLIPTPSGTLELLSSSPSPSIPVRKQILFFQHGGFGHAAVWLPYLTFFAEKGYRCYALSLRGHGGSWNPGYWSMVWGTSRGMLRGDLSAGVAWVKAREGVTEEDLVMIGHSAGGGLVQDFLGKGGRAGGMVLVGSFPWWGGFGVYKNWFRLDPWFLLRYYIRDFWHPRSPLSSTTLVKRAFFCDEYPDEQVREFERWMPEFESMLWPLGQMFAFTSVEEVLRGIVGWGTGKGSRVLVVAGERDRLMTGDLMGELAGGYEVGVKRILGEEGMVKGDEEKEVEVRVLEVVKGAGHHVQNDLQWVDGAERILRFLEQL